MYTCPRSEQSAYLVVEGKIARIPLKNEEKEELLSCQEHKCADCLGKISRDTCEIDHIWSLCLFGPDHRANMQALCHRCHAKKTKKEARILMQRRRRIKLIMNEHRRLTSSSTSLTAPTSSSIHSSIHSSIQIKTEEETEEEEDGPSPKRMKVSTTNDDSTTTTTSTTTITTTTDYSKRENGRDEELKCTVDHCPRTWWTYSKTSVEANPELKRCRYLARHARRSHIRRAHHHTITQPNIQDD